MPFSECRQEGTAVIFFRTEAFGDRRGSWVLGHPMYLRFSFVVHSFGKNNSSLALVAVVMNMPTPTAGGLVRLREEDLTSEPYACI
jgi:hypothetical protein